MIRPYAGLVVVEALSADAPLALRIGAAMTGRILADLGARVVTLRSSAEPLDEALSAFLDAGKQRLALRDNAITGLMAEADVALLDTLPQGQGARVNAVLSLFADLGDRRPATDFTQQALSGLLNMLGDPARQPLKLPGHQGAYALGLSAFAGIASALAAGASARETVRVSLLDTAVWLNWKSVPLPDLPEVVLGRVGDDAEWQVLRCADGHVALVYQESDWPKLCRVVGDPRLTVPEFTDRKTRLPHLASIATIIEEKFLTLTRRQLHDLALANGLPLGPVWSPAELLDDPHNRARELFDKHGAPRLPVLWNGEGFAADADEPRLAVAQ